MIGQYDFEFCNKNIHIYETRAYKRKYFDMIINNEDLDFNEFKYRCKCWYIDNILCLKNVTIT